MESLESDTDEKRLACLAYSQSTLYIRKNNFNPFPALIKSEYSHILFKKFITHEPYIKNTCNKVPQVEPDLSHS